MLSFSLGREPQRIDILTFASGLTFGAAYDSRVMVNVGGLPVPFISVNDLRTNKPATGRLRDLADAADLPPGTSLTITRLGGRRASR